MLCACELGRIIIPKKKIPKMLDICVLSLNAGHDMYSVVSTPLYVYVSILIMFCLCGRNVVNFRSRRAFREMSESQTIWFDIELMSVLRHLMPSKHSVKPSQMDAKLVLHLNIPLYILLNIRPQTLGIFPCDNNILHKCRSENCIYAVWFDLRDVLPQQKALFNLYNVHIHITAIRNVGLTEVKHTIMKVMYQ